MKSQFFPAQAALPMGQSPFTPEYDEFVHEYPGRGSLKIQTSVANNAFPIKDVLVDVDLIYKGKRYTIYTDVTDESGIINNIVLPASPSANSQSPLTVSDDPSYLISLYHPSFGTITNCSVTVHDRIETILPVELSPLTPGSEGWQ
ncbi:MAG: hypothetical protein IIZ36_03665 [Ruminococcus sp.]|nr:hypothetical protein [Ruminococcus sp.]